MRFIYFGLTIVNYVIFALDITYDRDFWTWMWLGAAVYFAINTNVAYKKFKTTEAKTKNETKALNIYDVSQQRELLLAYMEFIEHPHHDGAFTHEEFIEKFLSQ